MELYKRLYSLLKTAVKKPEDYILYPYIVTFTEQIGGSQEIIELIAKRLNFNITYQRYFEVGNDPWNEGIMLREIMYYEFWYYLKYTEPNIKKYSLPSTVNLLNMDKKNFGILYHRLFPKNTYTDTEYQYRLSIVTDYTQEQEYKIKEDKIKEDKIKEDKIKKDKIKKDKIKENKIKEDKIKEDKIKEDKIKD